MLVLLHVTFWRSPLWDDVIYGCPLTWLILFSDNEVLKSPDDANDLLYDKLLYQPPHVELRPPPPIIIRPLSDIDIYNAVIYEEDGELIPPDEETLSRRRLSASVPFGLNLLIESQNAAAALYAHSTQGNYALESTV